MTTPKRPTQRVTVSRQLIELRAQQAADSIGRTLSGPKVSGLFRQGTVTAVAVASPPSYTVDNTIVARAITGVRPLVGDQVYMIANRNDWVIAGRTDTRGWTNLTMATGWASWGGTLAGQTSPTASYSISGGVVFFRGAITNAGATGVASVAVTALPVEARPLSVRAHYQPELASGATGSVVRMDFPTTGEMRVVFAQTAGKIVGLDPLSWPLW